MKVSSDVLAVLSESVVSGSALALPGQLDRKMYMAVNKVLEAAGWRWNKKAKSHLCDGDAVDVLEQVLLTGEVTLARNEFGFFQTPVAVVDVLIGLAKLEPNHTVLEPSAGLGAIARAIDRIGVQRLDMCEILPPHVDYLHTLRWLSPVNIMKHDFLTVNPRNALAYDRVVMNPPFSRQADIEHVTHAMQHLREGGRLIAVMSSSITFRTDRKTAAFKKLFNEHLGMVIPLPDGSFKESGTMVNTVVVTMVK